VPVKFGREDLGRTQIDGAVLQLILRGLLREDLGRTQIDGAVLQLILRGLLRQTREGMLKVMIEEDRRNIRNSKVKT
jgi:hypothetical protein